MADPVSNSPVVIAGAGPVGLFSALLLVRQGYPVIVLEQNTEVAEDMRASTFHPATLDLLDRCDLSGELVAMGTPAQRWQYMIHGTDERAIFDLGVLGDLTRHPYRLQCEQFNLTRLIVERLRQEPLCDLRLGWQVTDVDPGEDQVRIRASRPGLSETFQTPWLIAADGGRSTVRKRLGLSFEGSVFPKTSITLVVRFPFENHVPGLLGVSYVWTDDAHYSLMQIRDLWRFSYSPNQSQTVEDALSEPVAQANMARVFPGLGPFDLLQRNYYTLHQRCLASFRVNRVLFAGDSAHLNSPAGGMGMNSGLHDAACLIEHLVPVLEGAGEHLLDRYDRRRRTIALEEVQRLSAKNYRRHRETDPEKRKVIWAELQETTRDRDKMRAFLMNSSMIRSRQREQEIA